jgi:FKBP-type peptidyl-prolyl cis-trans isomerase FkpA
MKTVLSIIVLLTFISCGGYSSANKKSFDQEIQAYLKKNKIIATKSESGVYSAILFQGTGEPVKYNDEIRVIYKGTLLNGNEFDSQYSPVEMKLKSLIPAWKEALVGVKEGSSILIVSPPQMAYGGQNKGEIPANSSLVFDITLLDRK